jgi:hypothetical protein
MSGTIAYRLSVFNGCARASVTRSTSDQSSLPLFWFEECTATPITFLYDHAPLAQARGSFVYHSTLRSCFSQQSTAVRHFRNTVAFSNFLYRPTHLCLFRKMRRSEFVDTTNIRVFSRETIHR